MIRTQLHRYTPLPRASHPMKRSQLAKESAKHRAERLAWVSVRAAAFEAAGGRCVFVTVGVRCPLPAEEGHHALAMAQGGNAETTRCVPLCFSHLQWCGDHSREAEAMGYTIRRSTFDPVAMPKGAEA